MHGQDTGIVSCEHFPNIRLTHVSGFISKFRVKTTAQLWLTIFFVVDFRDKPDCAAVVYFPAGANSVNPERFAHRAKLLFKPVLLPFASDIH